MPRIEVAIRRAGVSYRVEIEPGLLDRVGAEIEALEPSGVALVTDLAVSALYEERVLASFRRTPGVIASIPPGEESKTAAIALGLVDHFLEAGLDRNAVVVALGGGVVGDTAGFAAAIHLRGVRVVFVPTTVVAQVDSAIGGKVGVNHPLGKNLIGAFHQPALVLADPHSLSTLPDRERRAGLAEVVKYALIRSRPLLKRLEVELGALDTAAGIARCPDVIAACARIKAEVVGEDETEQGLRRILNFGHTFGHALEAATDYRHYRHGEAVAIGILAALDLSIEVANLPEEEASRGRDLVRRVLPGVPVPRIDRSRIESAVIRDKKRSSDEAVRAVVLSMLGESTTMEVPTRRIVDGLVATLERLREARS